MKLCAQKRKFPKKMLIFCFFVPKVCKLAKNETKIFLGYSGHGFVFASKKSEHLMGILGIKILAFELEL